MHHFLVGICSERWSSSVAGVIFIYVVIAIVIVMLIVAGVLGSQARRLDARPPAPLFDIDQAVMWIAERLPFELQAQLSHDDLRRIIDWNLDYFRAKGVAGNGSTSHGQGPIVVGGAETVDYVLNRAREDELQYTATQVHAVLEVQMAYLEAIGAIGPPASPDELS